MKAFTFYEILISQIFYIPVLNILFYLKFDRGTNLSPGLQKIEISKEHLFEKKNRFFSFV